MKCDSAKNDKACWPLEGNQSRALRSGVAVFLTWPAACIASGAISISQLVLNEIAWSPGDPGTGAPSLFKSNA